jgi:hypothetical protein
MDFDGVRALVVLPELPVAGGAVGGVPASVPLEELEDDRESLVRALVLLPEFAAAVGLVEFPLAELEVLLESFEVLFDFLLLAVPALPSPAAGVPPVGGVALAEGSAAALLFGLLVAVGVVLAFSPSVFPALLSLVCFLVLVFFEVVGVSPELACGGFAGSAESAAGFFFFFFLVVLESLCGCSVDCVD